MRICCVDKSILPERISGGTVAVADDWRSYIKNENVRWVDRPLAEKDTNLKQLIPYVLVQDEDRLFACYPRHGTESRLHGLYSCGIGGHIDETDGCGSVDQTVGEGMRRELSEELTGFTMNRIDLSYQGMIHETESEVGLCHLGLVYLARCKDGYRPSATDETSGLGWKSLAELRALRTELWTTLALSLLPED